jgi:hypothetical protein
MQRKSVSQNCHSSNSQQYLAVTPLNTHTQKKKKKKKGKKKKKKKKKKE